MSFIDAIKNKITTKAVRSFSGQTSSMAVQMPEKICLSNDPVKLMAYNRGYVYAANHKISSALASLPYHLYTVVDSGSVGKMITPHKAVGALTKKAVVTSAKIKLQDKKEMVEIYDHPILDLLKNPAQGWSQTEWLYVISTYLGIIGNAYLHKVVVSGQLTELVPLQSEYMTIRYDKQGVITEYFYQPLGSIESRTFKPSEIVHIRNRVAGSLIAGMGNLEACVQSFAVAYNAEQYAAALLSNNAMPAWVITLKNQGALPIDPVTGSIDETKMLEFENKWRAKWGGSNRGGFKFSIGDMDFKNLSATMADTQIDKFMEEAKKQICAAFSVPLSTLDETDSNKATALASMRQLKIYGVFPKVCLILDQLNQVFAEFFDSGLFVWIDQREALDPDAQEQATVLSTLKNAGIMSVNEARLTLGLPSLGAEYDNPIAANASSAVQAIATTTTNI